MPLSAAKLDEKCEYSYLGLLVVTPQALRVELLTASEDADDTAGLRDHFHHSHHGRGAFDETRTSRRRRSSPRRSTARVAPSPTGLALGLPALGTFVLCRATSLS